VKDEFGDVVHSIHESVNDRYGVGPARYPTGGNYPAMPAETIDKLDELLRGELSAVETYDLALRSVHKTQLSHALQQLRDNHARRVDLLRDRLMAVGYEASQTSGAWGAFARLVQRGADLLGDKAAMAALEEGEDHGLQRYTEDLDALDAQTREFVRGELLPEQERTHDLCRSLFRFVKAA
jgi:demethoxyubiquinone hydroxylase (CLK1/Coq7/Cat5 family)